MATKPYRPIDVRAASARVAGGDPCDDRARAARAFKRLYRWGTGIVFTGMIFETTGNRQPVRLGWEGDKRAAYLNASHGWKDFVHYLSHWLDIEVNGNSKHGKHHARFEARMIREVITRVIWTVRCATPCATRPPRGRRQGCGSPEAHRRAHEGMAHQAQARRMRSKSCCASDAKLSVGK